MSSFTHHLEKEVLDHFLKTTGLFLGLSRTNGNRRGLYATWDDDGEGGKKITEEGIDEPGQGWVKNEEDVWVTEGSLNLATSYERKTLVADSWHDVDVVLGPDGDSELRLSDTQEWAEATEDENWGTITHFFIADSGVVGDGNIFAWGNMPDSETIVEGVVAKIWANTVVVRMTD